MKILKSTTIAIGLAILATSCSHQSGVQLVYSGTITFSNDSTAIKSLSKNGYISYTHDGEKILIEADNKGGVSYSFNGNDKRDQLDDNQKLLLKEAIDGVVKSERDKINQKH
jgi:hypothetical protein